MPHRRGIALAAAAILFWPLLSAAEPLPYADCDSAMQAQFTGIGAGIRAGDRVAEFPPDDGCVTRLLARRVGDDGRVYRVSTTADDAAAVSSNVFAIQLKVQLHAAPDLWSSSEDPGGVYGYWTLGPVHTNGIAALRVKKPPGEARTAGHSRLWPRFATKSRRLFGRNPSGRDRFCPLLPYSSRQWVGHWPLLVRCTGQKRPPPQRPH